MSIDLYGIPNCDTVKKARAWLDARGIGYAFHDYKKDGANPETLAAWSDIAGWEALLNAEREYRERALTLRSQSNGRVDARG